MKGLAKQRKTTLLSDTELTKNSRQKVVGGDFPSDLTQEV